MGRGLCYASTQEINMSQVRPVGKGVCEEAVFSVVYFLIFHAKYQSGTFRVWHYL